MLMGLPGVDRAITHKLLHRKRPWLFPMLDSVTSAHLGGFRAWATIWEDLTRLSKSSSGSKTGSLLSRQRTTVSG